MLRTIVGMALLLVAGTATAQVPAPAAPANPTGPETLAEVNALRAQRGLPPYVYDERLALAAVGCARERARQLLFGHLPNDFDYLPPGTHARASGCAAWVPSMGWGSCCVYDRYQYAGAAWALGADGKRYMHLFVR